MKKQDKNKWWASHIAEKLGYSGISSFKNVVTEVVQLLILLEVNYYDHVSFERHEEDGHKHMDFRCSRLASYLCVLRADSKKEKVRAFQKRILDRFHRVGITWADINGLNRLAFRHELSLLNKSLNKVAFRHGVTDFRAFSDAGYEGLYGKNMFQLKHDRGISADHDLLDTLNYPEMVTNMLRAELTRIMLDHHDTKQSLYAEETARRIGQELGLALRRIGIAPNKGTIAKDVEVIKKKFHQAAKEL